MDDMVLNIATFQQEHFVDRSGLLAGGKDGQMGITNGEGRMKVLLVTFDRNMRSKARSRGIDAADEKDFGVLTRD